jgi:hypothetical protein
VGALNFAPTSPSPPGADVVVISTATGPRAIGRSGADPGAAAAPSVLRRGAQHPGHQRGKSAPRDVEAPLSNLYPA